MDAATLVRGGVSRNRTIVDTQLTRRPNSAALIGRVADNQAILNGWLQITSRTHKEDSSSASAGSLSKVADDGTMSNQRTTESCVQSSASAGSLRNVVGENTIPDGGVAIIQALYGSAVVRAAVLDGEAVQNGIARLAANEGESSAGALAVDDR